MTGWIIIGVILLIIVIILMLSVKVTAVYDARPEISVKILCFTLMKYPAEPKKKRGKAKKKRVKENAPAQKKSTGNTGDASGEGEKAPADDEAGNGKTAADKEDSAGKSSAKASGSPKSPKAAPSMPDMQMIKEYIESAKPPVKRLFRKIRIRDVYIDWVAGSDDAAKTALKYGGICAAVYSVTEWVRTYFDAKIKEVNIEADFDAEKDDIFAYLTVKLRIGTAVVCGVWLAYRIMKTYQKYNDKPVRKRPARVGR